MKTHVYNRIRNKPTTVLHYLQHWQRADFLKGIHLSSYMYNMHMLHTLYCRARSLNAVWSRLSRSAGVPARKLSQPSNQLENMSMDLRSIWILSSIPAIVSEWLDSCDSEKV